MCDESLIDNIISDTNNVGGERLCRYVSILLLDRYFLIKSCKCFPFSECWIEPPRSIKNEIASTNHVSLF